MAFRRLASVLPVVALDVQAALALIYPHAFFYLPWLLLAMYATASWGVYKMLREHRWVFWIVGARLTRISHGLEHATMRVLEERRETMIHGFTNARNRFVVAMERGHEHRLPKVRRAADVAIRRVLAGERHLMYAEGCGTSDVVFAVTLWLVVLLAGLMTRALGAPLSFAFAFTVVIGHVWVALETQLGLVAQRLFTVSSNFTAARVLDVRHVPHPSETWFEVILDIEAPTEGGLVAPGLH